MKKSLIFCSALLALGLVGCDDSSDLGIAQVNPQEAIMEVDGVQVAFAGALENDAFELSNYKETGIVPVISHEVSENLPEGASVELDMELATAEDFSDAIILPVIDGGVSEEAWDEYFRSKLGKSPAAKDNYVRFAAYVVLGAQKSRIGTPDTWLGFKKVTVTPIPMDFVLQDNYYLIGTINGWGLNSDFPMKHSASSVYDDPEFSIVIDITDEQAAGGWWWKIAPANAVADANWDLCLGIETDGGHELEGALFDNGKAGCINEAGSYLLTINVLDMTYSYKKMEFMYTPGVSNKWTHSDSQKLQYIDGVYKGFAHLNGGFKFTSQSDWAGINYGNAGMETPETNDDGVVTITGKLSTDGGAHDLEVAEDGLYFCEVNVETLEFTLTKINSWGMIGGFNSWGGDVALTPSSDFLTWTGDLDLATESPWKFRANGGWFGIDLGGQFTNLTLGGGNLNSPAGDYTVTLDFSAIPYSAEVVKK